MCDITLNVNFNIIERPPIVLLKTPTYSNVDSSIEFSFNTVPKNFIGAKSLLNFCEDKYKVHNKQLLVQIYDVNKKLEPILLEAHLDGSEYIFTTIVPDNSFWRVAFVYTFDLKYKNKVRKVEIIDDMDFQNDTSVFLPKTTKYPDFKFLRIKPLSSLVNKIQTLPIDANRYYDNDQSDTDTIKSRLKYVHNYVKSVIEKFKFNTNQYIYPPHVEENALMNVIEDTLIFDNDSGYLVMYGKDGNEYISGNDYSLAIAYDGSRPNVNLIELNIPNSKESFYEGVRIAEQGGGYMEYVWIDPNNIINKDSKRIAYLEAYNDYLILGITYNPDLPNIGDLHLAYIMCDFVQQFIGNFLMYNQKVPSRYQRYYDSIDDGHVTLVDLNGDNFIVGPVNMEKLAIAKNLIDQVGGGYIDDNTFCSKIPYYDYIVWYSTN